MTLERVLEPEAMATLQDAVDYNSMDHAEVNRIFVADLLAASAARDLLLDEILDLGTGTALIPIELCRQHPGCRVMAIDLAIPMLEIGRYNLEVAGMIDCIQLDHADAKDLPHEDDRFSAVISNGALHHIPRPQDALGQAVRVAAAGGLLFFRDLLRPANEGALEHLVRTYAGGENEHPRQLFADSLRAALTLDEVRQMVAQLGFAPAAVQATSDRHWTWTAWKPVSAQPLPA